MLTFASGMKDLAQFLVRGRIHRAVVVEDGRLRGWGLVGMHAFLADRVGLDLPLPPGVPVGGEPQDPDGAWSAAPAAEAVLVVEYGAAVADESTSWGVLKAIYR